MAACLPKPEHPLSWLYHSQAQLLPIDCMRAGQYFIGSGLKHTPQQQDAAALFCSNASLQADSNLPGTLTCTQIHGTVRKCVQQATGNTMFHV